MEDQTTTEEAVVDTGAQDALPVNADDTSAVADNQDQSATSEETPQGEQDSLPEADEKLKKYAESHGLELDSPSAVKAAKMAMNNQAEFHRTRQKSTQLEKSMQEMGDVAAEQVADATGQDPELLKRVQRFEIREAVRDFWSDNPQAREFEEAIKEKITESGISGSAETLLKAGWAMVQAENVNTLKSEGAKEALTSLASKQRTAAPSGSAVSSAPKQNVLTRELIAQKTQAGDIAWLNKNQSAIHEAMVNGTL